jgi:Flp pilus assembly protein TadD
MCAENSENPPARIEATWTTPPNNEPGCKDRGAIALERKQRDLTFEHLRKAVELNPESAIYHNSLAVACVRDGQRTVAVHHFWRAISIQPDYFDALKNLVIALREAGEFRETIRLMKSAAGR